MFFSNNSFPTQPQRWKQELLNGNKKKWNHYQDKAVSCTQCSSWSPLNSKESLKWIDLNTCTSINTEDLMLQLEVYLTSPPDWRLVCGRLQDWRVVFRIQRGESWGFFFPSTDLIIIFVVIHYRHRSVSTTRVFPITAYPNLNLFELETT